MASSSVLPAAQPLESACIWLSDASLWKKYNIPVGRYLKRWSRSDHTGVHSILAEGSNGGGVGVTSAALGGRPYCASLNSRTSFGKMASPGAKSVNRRATLISSPWKIPE